MKKAILTMAAMIALTAQAQAFTITQAVEVKAYQFNEILDKHLATEFSMWTGVDPETNKGYVEFHIDGGLQTFKMGFDEGDAELNNWKHMIDKTVEWSAVAATNNVDINKYFTDFDPKDSSTYKDMYNCETTSVKCYSSFSSWSDGQKSTMYINLEDRSNEFITFKGQVPLAQVIKLKASLDSLEKLWEDRRAELADKPKGADKQALFN